MRWSPRRAVEYEFRHLCPVKDRYEPFYGAHPVRHRTRRPTRAEVAEAAAERTSGA